ncbi:MAG: OFA family MFS transporter [Hespellia sp.]|nr:OFA family MFS transporter [Hespellia sp.]
MKTTITGVAKRALVVAVLLNLCTGAQYCWSMLGKSMIAEYGWTALQASLPYSVLMIVAATWAVGAAKISERWKPKYSTMLGAVCMCAGLIISGYTRSPIVMLFSVGLLLGMSSTSVSAVTAPTAVKFWPEKYKGLVSGIGTAGVALSSFYMSPIINALLNSVGLKMTFVIIGIAAGILIGGLSLIFPTPGKEQLETGEDAAEVDTSLYKNKYTGEQALKKYEFWILFLCMGCAAMSGQMLTAHVAMISVMQANWESGATLVMAIAVGNTAGRLLLGAISDRLGVFTTWKALFAVATVNMFLFTRYTSPATMIVGTVILAACYGACVPLTWASITAVFGKKYMGTIYGYTNISFGIASFIGPMAAAAIVDATGVYNQAFLVVAGFQLLGLVLAFTISDKKIAARKESVSVPEVK